MTHLQAQSPPTAASGYVQPHRGTTILVLGILSLVLGGACIGWILGIVAWVMGSADLKAMSSGRMDPTGHGTTQAGKICGIVAVCLYGLLAAIYLVFFVLIGGAAIMGAASGGGTVPGSP